VLDLVRKLLDAAATARTPRAFWQTAALVLSERLGGAQVRIDYAGLAEVGTAAAGRDASGEPLVAEWKDGDGRTARLQTAGGGTTSRVAASELQGLLDTAARLAVMVGLRTDLERERRLGSFIVELSRWLLAAPERDLMLRYTMQSVMSLVDAQGAFVALREPNR
jgi:hypothetical protein